MTTTLAPPLPVPADVTQTRRRVRGLLAAWDVARVRRIGLAVLALQLAALIAWGVVRADHFALTRDFSIYYQAWWLIAHGHLDPFDTPNGFPFWANHGELLMWPLSLFARVWPSPAALLSIQALGLVGAETAAFLWLCDFAANSQAKAGATPGARGLTPRLASMLAATGLVLLVADPWTYWADSFDFHLQLVGIAFLLLGARQIHRDPRSRWVWLWVALTLSTGDVMGTYLAATGICAVLAGRRWRRTGLQVTAVAVLWTVMLSIVHANQGSELAAGYGYLASSVGAAAPTQLGLFQLVEGVVRHPQRALAILWDRRLNLYASVASAGLLGVLSPWVAAVAILILVENGLYSYSLFAAPGFQGILLFVMVPVGTVEVLTRLARRRRRTAALIAGAVTIMAIGWGAVWLPRTSSEWVRVSPQAASVLSSVEHDIPTTAEVVVSQGVSGPFSGRRWIYPMMTAEAYPVHTSPVWVIVTPSQGIETAPVAVSDGLIAELAGPLHADLVAHRAGVWAFRWVPPAGTHHLVVPAKPPTIGAWSATGAAGTPTTAGPEADWRATATGKAGYVVAGDYWTEPPGQYQATVTLSTTVPGDVEVWNATGNVLLARRQIPATNGMRAVTMTVDATHRYSATAYGGAGPFVIAPLAPTPDNRLEIRVWTPGGGVVSVASLELVPLEH